MTKPLIVYRWNYRGGVCYFGEHAEIMRLAFNIPEDCEFLVQREMK